MVENRGGAGGTLGGSNYVGTLANEGVALAPYHDLATLVSPDLQAGLDAPYSCAGGACGTCRARILNDHAVMDQNHVLSEQEVEEASGVDRVQPRCGRTKRWIEHVHGPRCIAT